ncbi:MAG: tRNA (adenosine(37)-N6)-threonylcarbamoyltransferase complex dimerization subunit type 1 TsaB [Propionibacteriaceae bacterium]|nr:tRNA (adenosine(37)-N6)-threonylcarbamoyltransferase complex dimerization subunit type 1 TsaB [Propionibacteriaceae bacterium]
MANVHDVTLGIDTSAGLSVGVAAQDLFGDGLDYATRDLSDTRSHVEQLMPQIRALLDEQGLALADIVRIGVGVGPGPFTGLRVGIATAQTLGIALGVPVRGVCSLDVVAHEYAGVGDGEFVAVIDARRKELYWARYSATGERLGEPQVSAPAAIPPLPVVGPGVAVYPEIFAGRVPSAAPRVVNAGLVAMCLDDLPDAGLEPMYLRKPDAELAGTRKSVLTAGLRVPTTIELS